MKPMKFVKEWAMMLGAGGEDANNQNMEVTKLAC